MFQDDPIQGGSKMKSKYWLSICAVGALIIGFEIGGCSSDSGLTEPDGGKKDGPVILTGGSTGSMAGQTGSMGGQPGGGNTGAGGSTATEPPTVPPTDTGTESSTGSRTFGGGTSTR